VGTFWLCWVLKYCRSHAREVLNEDKIPYVGFEKADTALRAVSWAWCSLWSADSLHS
jgi:hypothetical protein